MNKKTEHTALEDLFLHNIREGSIARVTIKEFNSAPDSIMGILISNLSMIMSGSFQNPLPAAYNYTIKQGVNVPDIHKRLSIIQRLVLDYEKNSLVVSNYTPIVIKADLAQMINPLSTTRQRLCSSTTSHCCLIPVDSEHIGFHSIWSEPKEGLFLIDVTPNSTA